MRKLLFLLPLCCIALLSTAQSFQPGYIVKRAGDTSRGYIEGLPTYQLVQGVHFKNNLSESEFSTYTIKELSAFGIDGGKYFRELEYKDALHDYVSKTEFAKVVVLGHYNLYSIPRESQDLFYIKSEQDTGYLLYPDRIEENYLLPGNYRNILTFLARDCPNDVKSLETLFYSEKDVAKAITNLNKCVAPNTVSDVSVQKAKFKIQGLLTAGGFYLGKEDKQYHFHGAIRFLFPEMNRKFNLNLGFTYFKQNRLVSTGMITTHKTETVDLIKQSSIPLYANYYFLEGRFRPYVQVGASFTVWQSDRWYRLYNSAYNNGGIQESQISHIKTTRPAFLGAVGIDVFLISGLGLRAEYKYEYDVQWPTIGVFYLFNK